MSCRIETLGALSYDFCPDPLPVEAHRLRALVSARLVDEVTLLPVPDPAVGTPDRRLALHVAPRAAGDGLVGLAGKPAQVFPALAVAPATIPLSVAASGYLPLVLEGTLGPIAGFPDTFAPLAHGTVFMHRVGVAFKGRVVKRGIPANAGLGLATVEIDGMWSTLPPPNVSLPAVMELPRIVALTPGFYRRRPNATTLERCDFVDDVPQTKRLLRAAGPGTTRLRLSNRQTLAAGMPLLIDPPDPGRREVIGIGSVDTSSSDDQPASIELAYPLKHLHRAGARIVPASVPATHDARVLARPAIPGDAIAFLAGTAPWLSGALTRVDDGVNPFEYQWIDHYRTTADANGYFRLPRLARLALFRVRATHASEPQPLSLRIEPDYRRSEQHLSVAFE